MSDNNKRIMDQILDNVAFSQGYTPTLSWDNVVNLATFHTARPRLYKGGPQPTIDPLPLQPARPGVPTVKGAPAGAFV